MNDFDHINAFVAPGGYIVVTKGMMRQLRNQAELADVLGHEVAHVVEKHHLKALRKSALMSLVGAGYDPFGLPAALTTLAAANPKDAYLALRFKTRPAPEARIDKLALAINSGFDTLAASPLNESRFQNETRKLRLAAAEQ